MKKEAPKDMIKVDVDSTYENALKVFMTLSEEEKKFCVKDGNYKNVPYLYRQVIPGKAFVDLYNLSGYDVDIGFIVIAVNPNFRRKGLAKKLINNLKKNIQKLDLNIRILVWKVKKENQASIDTAEKLSFIKATEIENEFFYVYKTFPTKHKFEKLNDFVDAYLILPFKSLIDFIHEFNGCCLTILFMLILIGGIIYQGILWQRSETRKMQQIVKDYPVYVEVDSSKNLTAIKKNDIVNDIKKNAGSEVVVHFANECVFSRQYFCWHKADIKCHLCKKEKEEFDSSYGKGEIKR